MSASNGGNGGTNGGTTGSTTGGGTTGGGTTAGTTGGGTTGGNADMGPNDGGGGTTGGGGADMAGQCDVITQAGCGSNEKCVPTQTGNFCGSKGATSVPTAGLCLASMTPPSTNDECVAGDGCVSWSNFDNSKKVSVCQQFCKVDGDCKQPTFAGSIPPKCNGDLQNTTVYKACSISCNPYNAADGTNGCPAGMACTYGTDGTAPNQFEVTDCALYGTGDGSTDCAAHGNQDCKPGWICAGPAANMLRCHQLCRAGMNGDCTTGGQTCNSLSGPASPKFGVCG